MYGIIFLWISWFTIPGLSSAEWRFGGMTSGKFPVANCLLSKYPVRNYALCLFLISRIYHHQNLKLLLNLKSSGYVIGFDWFFQNSVFKEGAHLRNHTYGCSVVAQTWPCPKPSHRPKLNDHRWYNLKALLDWADNLGRWGGLGHGLIWTTTILSLIS